MSDISYWWWKVQFSYKLLEWNHCLGTYIWFNSQWLKLWWF